MAFYALIPFHDLLRVDLKLLVWIHHYAEQAGICLEKKKILIKNVQGYFKGKLEIFLKYNFQIYVWM